MGFTGDTVLPQVIAAHAAATPDRIYVTDCERGTYTYAEVHQLANAWADAFTAWGLQAGDIVLTMLPPRIEWLAAWLGAARCHGADCGVNTDFHGAMLRYVLEKSNSRILVIDAEYVPRLNEEITADCALTTVVVIGSTAPPALPGLVVVGAEEFLAKGLADPARTPVEPHETACLILTSGTTGPSKLVIEPWALLYQASTGLFPFDDVSADDALYSPLPVFHGAARFAFYLMALKGGRVVFRSRFSLRAFWDDIERERCTLANVFAFSRILYDAEPAPSDADNPLRAVIMSPLLPQYRDFGTRFGVAIRTAYGSSEVGVPFGSGTEEPPNSFVCGRARTWPAGYETRLVDEFDREVPDGTVGELIVRTDEPWCLTPGYYGMPEATASAWRNGWFHTGDGFKRVDGWYYFVDRMKDAIRRRGENISSFEVEAAVVRHPSVRECAAVAYPIPGEEDEVRLFIVPTSPDFDPDALYGFLCEHMPRFMLPRFIETVDELPRTEASGRLRKVVLRERALPDGVWDREVRFGRTA